MVARGRTPRVAIRARGWMPRVVTRGRTPRVAIRARGWMPRVVTRGRTPRVAIRARGWMPRGGNHLDATGLELTAQRVRAQVADDAVVGTLFQRRQATLEVAPG